MEARIHLPQGKQKSFLEAVLRKSELSVDQLAVYCTVTPRTFRDWHREKYFGPHKTFEKLARDFRVTLPKGETLTPYWYVAKGASLGGKKYLEMYGPPGTLEGRKKGGRVSQERRRQDPLRYKALGCNVAKEFIVPAPSTELAELIGVFLGDGGLTSHQATIYLSALVDREYSYFLAGLIQRVFRVKPSIYERINDHSIRLAISGVYFVNSLEDLGLKRGNKMKNKIRIPKWVLRNKQYATACVRGLFDTDGGFYFHRKRSGIYIGWCFTSYSESLLGDVHNVLQRVGLNAKKEQEGRLYMYDLWSIERYMELIGSHNPKNIAKFQSHLAVREKK
ncbi:MAG: hypothetical protein UX31_C0006G0037 [Candidatus Nomurabacteria bacterium GW2011_GWA1_46_11]|uniref:DOD-type homing endonuclease domain-containing protein n=2 Tax=Parcubacteria group TaxID=1794811 RepID=A0A1G1YWD1_9BACT|nr:MAG: hypothetical protein UX29_C0018G0005 [Parcubacteria group bacterium GW2011_GWA2_46_10]KKU22125.1 MAG: hypothetical protein UX31_C0006G0037 [Candidatus Nomurabacteria bacterium GW2011_GWA1_46_11]OGY56701.1 MAG: hypothetical protein A2119_02605 [Candidatus Colwellbacteria bacterium GWA2_46_10]